MHLDISHVVAAEQADRLRDSAQTPSLLASLLGKLLRRGGRQQPQAAWPARTVEARETDRLAA